jgi:Holliday junction resolvasome RuvABC endonuclease subunit
MINIGADLCTKHLALAARLPSGEAWLHKIGYGEEKVTTAKIVAAGLKTGGRFIALKNGNLEYPNDRAEPITLWLEDTIMGGNRNAQAAIKQGKFTGAVLLAAKTAGLQPETITVNEWKMELWPGGSHKKTGNSSKSEVAELVRLHWPEAYRLCGDDEDLMDACGICIAGSKRNGDW